MRLGIVCVISVLFFAGCSIGGGEAPESAPARDAARTASPPSGGNLLPCDSAISTDEDVPEGYEVLLGAIALPTANSAPSALQTGRHDDTDPPNYFAKTGLLVRPGTAFDLEVEHPRTAAIGWGSPPKFSSRISSQGCQGESWVAFAGGFMIQEPTCVRLTLTVDDQQRVFFVGAGNACQGQQPPSLT